MDEIIKKLKKNYLFHMLEEHEIFELCKNNTFLLKKFDKGAIIANEEDQCSSISLILKGSVEISRLYSCGKEIVISNLKDGDIFGEAIIFSRESKYPATVIALEQCEILYINKNELLSLFSVNEKVLEGFLSVLSNKVLMLNSKIKNISFKTVRQKVVNYILEKQPSDGGKVILLTESKEKIAALLGLPRPSLSRELMALRNLEYIDFDRNSITILNQEALEEEMFN